jgi:hypothetical protein
MIKYNNPKLKSQNIATYKNDLRLGASCLNIVL